MSSRNEQGIGGALSEAGILFVALIQCRECGKDVSTEASACPHCGAPQESLPPIIPQQSVPRATASQFGAVCPICQQGRLVLDSRYRMSGPVVAIGWLLLIPSILGIALGAFFLLTTFWAVNNTTSIAKGVTTNRLQAAKIPVQIIERFTAGEGISSEEMNSLTEAQRLALEEAKTERAGTSLGAGLGAAVLGGFSVWIMIIAFVGGLLGWLLIMRKRVLACGFCSAIWPAS